MKIKKSLQKLTRFHENQQDSIRINKILQDGAIIYKFLKELAI